MRPKVPKFSLSAVRRHLLTATARFAARCASINLVYRAAASKVGGCALMRHTISNLPGHRTTLNNIPSLAQVGNVGAASKICRMRPAMRHANISRLKGDARSPHTNGDPLKSWLIARAPRLRDAHAIAGHAPICSHPPTQISCIGQRLGDCRLRKGKPIKRLRHQPYGSAYGEESLYRG